MATSCARTVAAVLLLLALADAAAAALSCQQVFTPLFPCVSYIRGGGPVPGDCCAGIRSLYAAAQTAPDRQSVCTCLKTIASGASPSDLARAAGVPRSCGVNLPYNISPNVDCSRVRRW